MSKSPAIIANGISKSYGTFKAVNDLTFEVRHGEIFALLGPNGAGKSTTIRMILDIIRPDTGSIQVFGAPLNDATKDRIGYLPEERGLYKSVPLIEMLTYLGKLKGLSGPEAQKRGMALLEKMDLGEYAKKKADDLSKGMQQKVQFIVTILHQPDLIIVDEPFSGLDPINRLVIKNLLMDFRERGGSIVMSTHQMNQIEEMADRMLMISRGQQKLYGEVDTIRCTRCTRCRLPARQQKLYGEVDTIRRQFASHAIVVQGKGDWSALPGVTRVEQSSNGREGFLLHLAENVSADDVLGEIARSSNMTIEKFELAIPALDDIFIQVAGKDADV